MELPVDFRLSFLAARFYLEGKIKIKCRESEMSVALKVCRREAPTWAFCAHLVFFPR